MSLLAARSNFAVGDTITGKNRGTFCQCRAVVVPSRAEVDKCQPSEKILLGTGVMSSSGGGGGGPGGGVRDKY